MDKLIICETDRGRYAVRPIRWAGIWNEKGQIKESLNHLALFIKKEDAEKFVEWKNAEEQGKLLKLPCAVGDTVYQHMLVGIDKIKRKPIYEIFEAVVFKFSLSSCGLCFWTEVTDRRKRQNEIPLSTFNKTVFLTREEAEAALNEAGGKEDET